MLSNHEESIHKHKLYDNFESNSSEIEQVNIVGKAI